MIVKILIFVAFVITYVLCFFALIRSEENCQKMKILDESIRCLRNKTNFDISKVNLNNSQRQKEIAKLTKELAKLAEIVETNTTMLKHVEEDERKENARKYFKHRNRKKNGKKAKPDNTPAC